MPNNNKSMPNDIFSILQKLEYELSDKRGFFGKKVDIDKCWGLVVQLKKSLPECLQEANDIVDNREKLLKNADIIAQSIIKEAEARVASMLDIVEEAKKAQEEGQKIVDKAHKQSTDIVNTTKQHLDKLFEQTEEYIQMIAQNIKQSREELRESAIISG